MSGHQDEGSPARISGRGPTTRTEAGGVTADPAARGEIVCVTLIVTSGARRIVGAAETGYYPGDGVCAAGPRTLRSRRFRPAAVGPTHARELEVDARRATFLIRFSIRQVGIRSGGDDEVVEDIGHHGWGLDVREVSDAGEHFESAVR